MCLLGFLRAVWVVPQKGYLGTTIGCFQSVGGTLGSGLVWVNGGFCTSGVMLFPLWCVFFSLCLGSFVCGSCVFCGFRVSLVSCVATFSFDAVTFDFVSCVKSLCGGHLEKTSTIHQSW